MDILKVIVVDDEVPIREELRMLPWGENGFELLGEASNGKEAFELCQKCQPDIIITDIVMPLMDGLELTRLIKDWNPQIQIILLSLYQEFSYAMDAMRLGAREYLLKGVYSDEDLLIALNNARQAINKEKMNSFYHIETINNERSLMLSRFLKSNDLLDADVEELKLKLPARVVNLELEWDADKSILTERDIRNCINSYNYLNIKDMIFLSRQEVQIFLPDTSLKDSVSKMEAFIDSLEKQFTSYGIRCFVIIGNVVGSHIEYKKMYYENKMESKRRFYSSKSQIFTTTDVQFDSLSYEEVQSIHVKIKSFIMDTDAMKEFLYQEFIPLMMTRNIEPEEVKLLVSQWFTDLKRNYLSEEIPISNTEIILITNIYDLIQKWVTSLKSINVNSKMQGRIEIEKAVNLIEKRFNELLTLEEISREVGLSPNYLGYLFKKIKGENFKDYIIKLRMEKAIYLLKNTNLKIYEVAEKVGFSNYRYFSGIFQEYTGKSPREYKGGV